MEASLTVNGGLHHHSEPADIRDTDAEQPDTTEQDANTTVSDVCNSTPPLSW